MAFKGNWVLWNLFVIWYNSIVFCSTKSKPKIFCWHSNSWKEDIDLLDPCPSQDFLQEKINLDRLPIFVLPIFTNWYLYKNFTYCFTLFVFKVWMLYCTNYSFITFFFFNSILFPNIQLKTQKFFLT